MSLKDWLRPGRRDDGQDGGGAAWALYRHAVARARTPGYYAELGVPDTTDGRFELVAIHTALIMRRLRELGGTGPELAQQLAEVMMTDMDRSVRELGVGDLSVSKHVRRMAGSLMARLQSIEAARAAGDDAPLHEMLSRNLADATSSGGAPVDRQGLVHRLQGFAASVDAVPPGELLAGRGLPADAPTRPSEVPGPRP